MSTTPSAPGHEMSFLEHLDELRSRLVRSAIAIAVMFVVGWFFADRIFNFLSVPVTAALAEAKAAQQLAVKSSGATDLLTIAAGTEIQYTFRAPVQLDGIEIPAGTTISARIEDAEDGKRTIVPTRPWGVGQRLFPAESPLPADLVAKATYAQPGDRLVIETVQGTFNLYVKVAFYTAIVFAMPFLLLQLWGFISPGLYAHERSYVIPFVGLGSICFGLGVFFAYTIAFPAACKYLIELGAGNFQPLINADEYFDLILFIMLGLGLVFQIPTVTYFLARLGLLTAGTLIKFWRYALIGIFLVAAVVSPTADIPNLLVFAAPMIALYTISVGIAWVFHRKRQTDEEYEAD
ncbi:MAG: twin-arginine translocase subunit TatC [Blastocatellia bacterium]|jgi:sec-independent protein translocase protein TatC|nr:twin-arginine translocase subunit TatC [Blastocatellia bacterium]MBK6428144.1 twin-arginine translocase subunit TatC [Blastocatellia bacterium]